MPINRKVTTRVWAGRPSLDRSWQDHGRCFTVPPDTFHPDRTAADEILTAMRVCAPCPVRKPCHTYAVEDWIRDGVWGGLDPARIHRATTARYNAVTAAYETIRDLRKQVAT